MLNNFLKCIILTGRVNGGNLLFLLIMVRAGDGNLIGISFHVIKLFLLKEIQVNCLKILRKQGKDRY